MPGHPDLKFPAKRSELQRLCETMRNHHRAMAQQDKAIVSLLRPALGSLGGRLGVDAKIGAYRVCRQLTYVAGCNQDAAKGYIRAYDLYEQMFANKGRARRQFDPNA